MQKYYTAVGRFERKGRMGDMTCPKLEEKFSCPRNEWLFLLSI